MENELEELKARLAQAEARHEVTQDLLWSHHTLLVKLLRLLHERELLALPDVIAALQSGSAFAQGAFDKKPPATLPTMIATLQAIADAYAERGKPQ